MRSHSEYIPLTQEQIAAAQHTDIAEYLRERGEKVHRQARRCRSFCAKLLSQKLPARCA